MEEPAVLETDWKIFRGTKTEEHYKASPPGAVYYCSDVNSDCLFSCCPVRYLQTVRNVCQDIQLEEVRNYVFAKGLRACDCGFDLWSCH